MTDIYRAAVLQNKLKYLGEENPLLIDANNIYQYFRITPDEYAYTDMPNVRPPFEEMWIEWDMRKNDRFNTVEGWSKPLQDDIGVGVLISKKILSYEQWINTSNKMSDYLWSAATMFFKTKNKVNWMTTVTFSFTESGKPSPLTQQSYWKNETVNEDMIYLLESIKLPIWLTFSFMHCKNVELVTRNPKYVARMERKKRRIDIYKTLIIDPKKASKKYEDPGEKTGEKRRLHICRGHFKDFTEGPGLFGKYHGIYWVPSHTRGDNKLGTVYKDYEVLGDKD